MRDERPVVLVVDDDPLSLNGLVQVLDPDYQLKATTKGPDALALAQQAPVPQVVLPDVMMPEMDGYAVCAASRRP